MMTRLHKILIGLLVAQIALVVVTATQCGEPPALKEQPLLAKFDAATVTRLQVFPSSGPAIDIVKRGDSWVLASSFDYPAEATKVTDVLTQIAKMAAGEPIATQPARHAQLRVADAAFERKLVITAGGKDTTVFLGTPAGSRRNAVRLGGSDHVYAVAGVSAPAIGGEPSAWVNTRYIDVPRDEVTKVTIDRNGSAIELTKVTPPPSADGSGAVPPPAPDQWNVTMGGAPLKLAPGESLDTSAIGQIVSSATAIQMATPGNPQHKAVAAAATITIERKPTGATTATPQILDVVAIDDGNYWVHERGRNQAVLVPKPRLDNVVTVERDKLVSKPAPPATTNSQGQGSGSTPG
ncbi:MAG: DUF4340 domain-containing protein [Kofleriaceae bacterium]